MTMKANYDRSQPGNDRMCNSSVIYLYVNLTLRRKKTNLVRFHGFESWKRVFDLIIVSFSLFWIPIFCWNSKIFPSQFDLTLNRKIYTLYFKVYTNLIFDYGVLGSVVQIIRQN